MFFERHVHADNELPIYFNHQTRSPQDPKYAFHWHETAEWIFVTDGRVEIRINDQSAVYQAGDLVVINPQHPHCFCSVGKEASYYCLIPDNSLYVMGGIDPHSICTKPLVEDEEIKRLYRLIVEEFEKKDTCYKSCIKAAIVMMTSLLLRRHNTEEKNVYDFDDNAMRITKDAIRYIEEHYSEDFSGEALAAHLGFSRSYLCHVINKVTGQSLTENLLYVRCRKAKELLRRGMPVGDVGFAVGFKNASYFCRTYKRMMGAPPSADRRK